jgi:hypothetical protein
MKISYILLIVSLCLSHDITGQSKQKSKLELMQGFWQNTRNSELEKAFTVIKGNRSLNFVYDNSIMLDFPLNESIEGFQDFSAGDIDSINTLTISDEGLHYTIVDKRDITANGWAHDYLTPSYFECDGELMSINGGQLVEYGKIDQLPFGALMKLYKRGKIDRRGYIKEYLDLNVLPIKANCNVYSTPNGQTKLQLNKDDMIIVIEDRGDWLKVQYNDSGIGWIRKGDAH